MLHCDTTVVHTRTTIITITPRFLIYPARIRLTYNLLTVEVRKHQVCVNDERRVPCGHPKYRGPLQNGEVMPHLSNRWQANRG